jgi:hypothetical protein
MLKDLAAAAAAAAAASASSGVVDISETGKLPKHLFGDNSSSKQGGENDPLEEEPGRLPICINLY